MKERRKTWESIIRLEDTLHQQKMHLVGDGITAFRKEDVKDEERGEWIERSIYIPSVSGIFEKGHKLAEQGLKTTAAAIGMKPGNKHSLSQLIIMISQRDINYRRILENFHRDHLIFTKEDRKKIHKDLPRCLKEIDAAYESSEYIETEVSKYDDQKARITLPHMLEIAEGCISCARYAHAHEEEGKTEEESLREAYWRLTSRRRVREGQRKFDHWMVLRNIESWLENARGTDKLEKLSKKAEKMLNRYRNDEKTNGNRAEILTRIDALGRSYTYIFNENKLEDAMHISRKDLLVLKEQGYTFINRARELENYDPDRELRGIGYEDYELEDLKRRMMILDYVWNPFMRIEKGRGMLKIGTPEDDEQ